MKEYSITHHAIDRLIERCVRATSRWPELLNRDKNPNKYKNVIEEILTSSSENKTIINNTAYMVEYLEKYGYDHDFSFYESERYELKFVFARNRNTMVWVLVTVMNFYGRQKGNKWKLIPSKKEKELTKTLRRFEEVKDTWGYLLPELEYELQDFLYNFVMKNPNNYKQKITAHQYIFEAKYQNLRYKFYYSNNVAKLNSIEIIDKQEVSG